MSNAALITLAPIDEVALGRIILDGTASIISRILNKVIPKIRRRIQKEVIQAIRESPVYRALVGGDTLRGQLGVVDPQPVLDAVAVNIASGVLVTPIRVATLTGGMLIEIVKDDYSEVLLEAGSSFTSERGQDIDWLRWLTLEGGAIIIGEYHFQAGQHPGSRTGFGIMSRGGSWKVPDAFAGTNQDNWITTALLGMLPELESILFQELTGAF